MKQHDIYGNIYHVEKIGKSNLNSYADLVNDFENQCDVTYDLFTHHMKSNNYDLNKYMNDDYSNSIRRLFFCSKNIIIEVVERILIESDIEKLKSFYEYKMFYKSEISKIINIFTISPRRGDRLSNHIIDEKCQYYEELNKRLFSFII